MVKSLGSFRAALLIGWGVLGMAGMLYAQSKGIPSWAALPVVAAFLIEYPFYLVPGFPALRERLGGVGASTSAPTGAGAPTSAPAGGEPPTSTRGAGAPTSAKSGTGALPSPESGAGAPTSAKSGTGALPSPKSGAGVPLFALAAALLPYLACCCGAVAFSWGGLVRVIAASLALSLWFVILPSSRITDVAYLALWAAMLLGRFFNPAYVPLHPEFRDLKNVIIVPHLSMISIAVMALMLQRRVPETGYGFVPDRREWRIGLLHFLYFVPIGLPLALLLRATHFVQPKPAWYIAATFLGMLWVASLSEEFFVRGVLQQWIEDWTLSRGGALLITSAIFGLLHLWLGGFPNWKWAIVAGILGWFCGRARNQAGSIRASMVTHALVATTWRAFFA